MKDSRILNNIVEACLESVSCGRHPLVVFDLDSTLFDNGPRIHQILLEYATEQNLEPVIEKLKGLEKTGLPYGLPLIFDELHLFDQEHREGAKKYWLERFFSDHYQQLDEPLLGAIQYVNLVHQTGATVIYLSGRDSPGMLVGCSASLRENGFPVGVANTTLILKPNFEMTDLNFKQDALSYINKLGEVVGTFDNEPANCNLFLKAWPEATHVWVDSNHTQGAPPLEKGIYHIDDFCVIDTD